MGARLDKARILLNLASPRQRGLKLKEIVNKNNDRQKVWVRDVKRSSQIKQTTQKVEKALSFRSPKYAPEGTLKRLGLSTEIDLYSEITEGYEIARPYIKDEPRIKELRADLDAISGEIHQLTQDENDIYETILESRNSIDNHIYSETELPDGYSDYRYLSVLQDKEYLEEVKQIVSDMGETGRSKEKDSRYSSLLVDIESMENGLKNMSQINTVLNHKLDQVDDICKESEPLLDHKGLMKEIRSRSGLTKANAEEALSEIDFDEVEDSGFSRKKVEKWTKEGLRLIGKKVNIESVSGNYSANYVLGDTPCYYHKKVSLLGLSTLTEEDNEAKRILLHEMAHSIEEHNPEVAKINSTWVYRRQKDFFDPYVGTLYMSEDGKKVRATEVTSTGLEMMVSHRDAVYLLLRDPEHFAITLKGLTM